MYSKTMAQTVSEEPVEFQDTLVAPEADGCTLTVAGFLADGFESLTPPDDEQQADACVEMVCGVSSAGGCDGPAGVSDATTRGVDDITEKTTSMDLEEERIQVENGAVTVAPFSVIQTQCKSEEDDGYCSRSSLDSPVQTSQSDSETNDPDVFALKETSSVSQPGAPQKILTSEGVAVARCPSRLTPSMASVHTTTKGTMPAPSGISSSSAAHSAAQQKILIVNKTANVKYLIPTSGEPVKSSKALSIPSVSAALPPTTTSLQLPHLVNLKILKPALNKFRPGQITLLRVPDKETAPGLSSAALARPSSKQPSSAKASTMRTSSFVAVSGSQLETAPQVGSAGSVLTKERDTANPALLRSTGHADAPFLLKCSAAGTVSKGDDTDAKTTEDSPEVCGSLGNGECRSDATIVIGVRTSVTPCGVLPSGNTTGAVSSQTQSNASLQAAAAAADDDALQPHPEGDLAYVARNDGDKRPLPLETQPADDVPAAAAADQDSIASTPTDVTRNNYETVPRTTVVCTTSSLNRIGVHRLAVGSVQPRLPVEGISYQAVRRSPVVVAAAGNESGVLSATKVDKFKKPLPMAGLLPSAASPTPVPRSLDQTSASKACPASRSGTAVRSVAGENDSQRILKACLSSTAHVEESGRIGCVAKGAVNGQTGVANRNSVYQLGGRNNQDVTVILLPQVSLQSIPKKTTNSASESACKRVVLRIGPSQVFKTVSVNTTDSLKTQPLKSDEKQPRSYGSESREGVNGRELVSETVSKTSQRYDNSALNKTTNVTAAVKAEKVGASSKAASSAGKPLLKPEKDLQSLPKSSASIGHFASLSLPGLHVAKPSNTADSTAAGKQLTSTPAPKPGVTAIASQFKGQKTVVQAGTARARTNDGSNTYRSRISRQGLHTMRKSSQSAGYLHPLIDHDYCQFSAFCADVQSSIISLTDSSIRPERRYVKKNRAARTKAMRVSQYMSENCPAENRPKRKYCRRKQGLEAETGKKYGTVNGKIKAGGKALASPSKGVAITGKDSVQSSTTSADDKDYVKIPGYYQDEYVYYATKRLPGRPRNRAETSSRASDVIVAKPPTTTPAGISVFDWYKEMAQTDKTSRFGAAENADCTTRSSYLEEPSADKDCTPVDESDVADLVMDMLPSGDLVRPISDDMKFMTSSGIVDSLLLNPLDMGMLATTGGESSGDAGSAYLNLMAEEVRMMLSSMGEAELKLLESHLENEKIADELHADGLDINSYLGDYATHETNMSQSSVSNLLDVDDINDGDLLSADIANMNTILNDLNATSCSRATHDDAAAKLDSGGIGSFFDKSINGDDFVGNMHDIGLGFTSETWAIETSDPNKRTDQFRSTGPFRCSESSSTPVPCDASPPELTTINMFWNDLPGLLMNGKEFVRLVDIHKQIMPAKDTGILKKRCHMMGLHITNCTELQRDFLIRYMNAAKSKSTVIIAKDAAIMLIGFYVNPKSRSKGVEDFELDTLPPPPPKLAKPSAQRARHEWSVASKLKQPGSLSASSQAEAGSLPAGSEAGVTTAAAAEEKNICAAALLQPAHKATSIASSSSSSDSLVIETGADIKRSERLRHKHVSYADMIHGGLEDSNEKRSGQSEGIQQTSACDNVVVDEDGSTVRTRGITSCLSENEQAELENLVREQKRRRLSVEEKLRLKLLRNFRKSSTLMPSSKVELSLKGTRTRLMKSVKRTRRILAWKRRKLPNASAGLHTLEHCYAASPARLTGGVFKRQNSANHQNSKCPDRHFTRNNHVSTSALESSPLPATLPPKIVASATKSTTVGVIHRDVTCRVNRRRRSQMGELVTHLYTSSDALCIRCSNCREMLSVQQFLKHMHWRRGSEKLVRVTIAQKLHLQGSARTPDNLAAWDEFQKKRARFEGAPEAQHTGNPSRLLPQRERSVVPKEPGVTEGDSTRTVHHPSTRHSSRVSKRKLLHPVEKYVFANTNALSDTAVNAPGPDTKRRRLTTDAYDHRSSVVVGEQPGTTPTATHSKLPQRQKPNNLSPVSRDKGKLKRRAIVPSDRLLRVTTRRTQDSRLTSASALD